MYEASGFRYTLPDGETPSEGVIKTIATLEDRDPMTLDTPLYTVIDPDALDRVFGSNGNREPEDVSRVVFEFHDYRVTVQSDGVIRARAASTHPTTGKPA